MQREQKAHVIAAIRKKDRGRQQGVGVRIFTNQKKTKRFIQIS